MSVQHVRRLQREWGEEMAAPRRLGAPDAKTPTVLLDAAEQLMRDEGYAAVTSRRVAAAAGLKPQLVHYYFRTMDDLFLALFRRGAEHNFERQTAALASAQPLRALWEFSNEPAGTALTLEFTALANHRKAIRAEIAEYAARFRSQQTNSLTEILARYGVDGDEFAPLAVIVLMNGLSRVMSM